MKKTTLVQVTVVIGIVAALLVIVASISGAATVGRVRAVAPSDPGFPVKIGVALPLSGDAAGYGEPTRNGVLLAIDEAEAAGWQIEVILADTQCDSSQAVSVTNDLIVNHGVNYILGGACSGVSIAMSEVTNENQVVQLSPISSNPWVTKDPDGTNKDYVFRACFIDPALGMVMATVAADDLGASRAAILHNADFAYSSVLADAFHQAFEALGGTVPVWKDYSNSTTDFTDLVTEVQDAGADVLFLPDTYTQVNRIAAEADLLGLEATLLGADWWETPGLDLDLLEGGYFTTHFWSEDPRPVVQDFTVAYTTAYGTDPDALGALGYDAANVLLQAIADAGADDPVQVRDVMAAISHEGAAGHIRFDHNGDALKQGPILKIEGGATALTGYVAPRVAGLTAENDGPVDRGEPVTLTATVATDHPTAFSWAFGDGGTGSGPVVSHVYATAGLHTAVVTASNGYEGISVETVVSVRETVTITNTEATTTSDGVLNVTASPEMTETLTMTYTPQATTTSSPGDFEVAGGVTFHLDVRDEEGNVVSELSSPLTLTVGYDESALPAYLHEEDLEVRRYDEATAGWVALPMIERDMVNDQLTVLLDHFSEFALLGPVKRVYLPVVMR